MYSQVGIQCELSTTILSGNSARSIIPNPIDSFDRYSHTNKAIGGYDSCSLSFALTFSEVPSLYANSLGGHIVVYNEAGSVIWEGFVNALSVSIGGLGFSLGPVLDIANRVRVDYQTQSWNTNPPIPGHAASTAYADDADSQDIYGIIEQIVSGGQTDSTTAAQQRDAFLLSHAWPTGDRKLDINGGGEGEVRVSLDCLGYWHILKTYYYTQTASSGTENISDKIEAIAAAHPLSLYATRITENTSQVNRYEDGTRKASNIMDELIDIRDASDILYVIGCRANQELFYQPVPDSVRYLLSFSDVIKTVRLAKGLSVVYNWDVQAGEFLIVPELTFGNEAPLSNTDTSRLERMFIESVSFTMPWDVGLTGSKFSGVAGRLTRRGLI